MNSKGEASTMERFESSAMGGEMSTSTLPDVVYNRLRAAILAGEYRPAQILRQEELAFSLGVSRAPLREALPRLVADGLVVSQPRRGYVVRQLSESEVVEIFDMRMLLEGPAMAYATQARTRRDVSDVEALLLRLEAIRPNTEDETKYWTELNFALHDRMLAPCPRETLKKTIRSLRATVEPHVRLEISLTADLSEADREHRALFKAFSQGDDSTVAELSREHFVETKLRLIQALNSRECIKS